MPYWQLFYHLVWATKGRAPLLAADTEEQVHHWLRQKALDLEAVVFAVNGMPDHVHMVAAIPPKIAVAQFVGQIKAVSATKLNRAAGELSRVVWQAEYGVFSFDGKRLPNYVHYVEHQKQHHQTNDTIHVLERTDDAGPRLVREAGAEYGADANQWREELAGL